MDVLQEVRERDHETPIFMITAYGSVEAAVQRAEAGRQRLFLQALGQREAADRDRPHDRAAAARIREHAPQARPQAALQLPQHHRQERAHGAHARPGGPGGPQPFHHPDHRRDRHGQGTGRQSHPRQLAARRADVRGGEQRLAAAGSAGIHAVRPCAGRLHQRHPVQEGLLRGGRPRHHFLRRDRHHRRRRPRSSCCA